MVLPVISDLRVRDLDDVMVLERRCFEDPWTRRMYLSDLTDNQMATYLVLRPPQEASLSSDEAMPRVLAYGGFWLLTDEAHVATLASHPEWRGCGLASYLMLALLARARERGAVTSTLEVRAGNLGAQQLYLKLGYRPVGVRRRYYRNGEDGLIMTTPVLDDPALRAQLDSVLAESLVRIGDCFARFARNPTCGSADPPIFPSEPEHSNA